MTERVVGIDVGGSSVKVWIQGVGGRPSGNHGGGLTVSGSAALVTDRPSRFRAELDPARWWASIRALVRRTVDPFASYAGLVVSSLRQGSS
ncbi:MAG: hypothetical protein ACRDYA_16475 [Egibacteraceae bacterium]